jgi:hypothetical protein
MTQLAARTGVSDTYPAPSNAVAKAALAAIWDVVNEMSQAAEIDLASAATTNIGGQTSRKLRITGTTGITSFGTTYHGPIVLRFSGALTITHNATTLVCPGGANLAVEAGDILIVSPKCTTSGTFDGWAIVSYQSVNGDALGQNSKSAAYTTVLKDANKHILHPAADNNARTFTIDSNANVPYPIGTTLTFVNEINTVTIAITSDTLAMVGSGSTGSRTLAANGMATALKITATKWMISGTGLS